MSTTKIISISGSGGNAGKTLLAEKLLPCLPNCVAIKVQAHGERLTVTVEESPEQSPGKDTSRYLASGARRAYLIHGPSALARPVVEEILADGAYDTALIESNSMAREFPCDLRYYVRGPGVEKHGADLCRQRADIVVSATSNPHKEDKQMETDKKQTLQKALNEVSKDGRVSCKEALALAERLGVDSRELGETANELKIKIKGCQLGCF